MIFVKRLIDLQVVSDDDDEEQSDETIRTATILMITRRMQDER